MTGGLVPRLVPLAFVAIVVAAIVALLAGYGVPVGIGALAGFILGALAGLFGTLWVGRGTGRSIGVGGFTSWSSRSGSEDPSEEMGRLRERTELLSVDLGPITAVLPVLASADAGGLAIQLVTAEIHEAGVRLEVDVRPAPGSPAPGFLMDLVVGDDLGTDYRASGQNAGGTVNPSRYGVAVIPRPPAGARRLSVRIERFLDPFPGPGRISAGPWTFTVTLPGA
jgi:hypothetical protein